MKREFLFNLGLLVLINVLVKPFFIFGVDLTVQNRVPEGDYGLYFTLINFTYIFQIFNDFGIQNFNNRQVSQHPHLLAKYFPNLLALKALLSLFYFLLAMLAAWSVAHYDTRALALLGILLINQILTQGILFLRSNISGLGYFRLDSLLSSLDKLLMLGTCGLLLWANPLPQLFPFSIESFALAQTVALAITVLIVFVLLRRKAAFSIRPSWASNWRAGRPALLFLFKKSLPYALVILLMTAYTRLDAVLLERILPDGKIHADVYAGAYRLLDAANMFGYLFASLLLPMFARLLKGNTDGTTVRPLVSLSFKLIWAGSVTLAATVFFARQPLVELMMPERASPYRWDTLGILIWAFVPVCTTYIFSTLLTAHERLMQMNRFFIIGLGLDIVLNVSLVPHWKAQGAAVATLSTQVFIAICMVWLCTRTFRFRAPWSSIAQVLGFAFFVVSADALLFAYVPGTWFGHVAGASCIGVGGLFLFKMIDLRRALAFVKG